MLMKEVRLHKVVPACMDGRYKARLASRHPHAARTLARPPRNTKGYSITYLAMGFANVWVGTQKRRAVFGYPPEH